MYSGRGKIFVFMSPAILVKTMNLLEEEISVIIIHICYCRDKKKMFENNVEQQIVSISVITSAFPQRD